MSVSQFFDFVKRTIFENISMDHSNQYYNIIKDS